MLITYKYKEIQSHNSKTLKNISNYDLFFKANYLNYCITDQSYKLKIGDKVVKEIISNNINFNLVFEVMKIESHLSIAHLLNRI